MDNNQYEAHEAAVEALLFAGGEAVSVQKMAQALDIDEETCAAACDSLSERCAGQGGLMILKLENSYQMCTKKEFAGNIRKLLEIRRNTPLSPAAMEVLAIVAYNQPVTRAFIEQVRGVDCIGVVGSLVEKGLIEERGRLELPGRPLLYGTTPEFLRCFNISSLDELPPLPQDNPDNEQLTIDN